ncbi:MAG TPA: hypothetical protein DCP92_19325 [Nitrospiraceae bacterium]|jgi:hypothetical protein|nr:hypothetical protein [Nitrospiraceae bacterium]
MKRKLNFKCYLAGSVSLLTFIVYLASLHNEFVNWDDDVYILDNPHIRSINIAFFKWAFFDFYASNWHPLTWITHALDYAAWGLNPLGHHLTNIILHSLNTFVVVLLIIGLIEALKERIVANEISLFHDERTILIVGGITGILFGLHPLHVESVAWIAERKDLLCALFFLLSITAYTKYVGNLNNNVVQKPTLVFSNKHYLLSLAFFVLALLSKPMAVSLPLVLLILDRYPFKRIESLKTFQSMLAEKLPFIVFSLVSAILTVLAQKSGGAMGLTESMPFAARISVAANSLVAYLWKMILPLTLIPFYPYPRNVSPLSLANLLSIFIVTGITVICSVYAKRHKLWLSLWGYYVVTLLPVLGMVQVGRQSMADRYTYLPSLGPFLIIGLVAAWGLVKTNRLKRGKLIVKLLGTSMAIFVVVSMTYLTFKQIGIWKDSISLWSYVIDKRTDFSIAYNNRGNAFAKMGSFDKAIADYDEAIALNRSYYDAYNNRGVAFAKLDQIEKAIAEFDKAIALNPSDYRAYGNRGLAFDSMGEFDKAIADFDKAIALNQNDANSLVNRGLVHLKVRQVGLAISDFRKACDLGNNFGCNALGYPVKNGS